MNLLKTIWGVIVLSVSFFAILVAIALLIIPAIIFGWLDKLDDEKRKRFASHPNAEVSEVAVADSTKTRGVRPPLSLD
jgi:hypothetical protein